MSTIVYTCSVCALTFTDETSLTDHMLRDHTTKTETIAEGEEK